MKLKINHLFLTVAMITALQLTTMAQNEQPAIVLASQSMTSQTPSTSTEKSITGTIVLPEKLLKNFNRNFPTASNIKWTTTPESFLANFISEEKAVSTTFNKKGQFMFALIYGKEKDLPETIQRQIRKDFSAFTVYKVIEIKTSSTKDYQVILQNATHYMELNITGAGQVQETKKFQRADG